MKKIIISGFFVAAFALVATIFYNNASKPALSDLAKANIKALAANEVNTGDDDAFNPFDGSGTGGSGSGCNNCTWYVVYVENLNTTGIQHRYEYTLGTNNKCERKLLREPEKTNPYKYCYVPNPQY